LQDVEAHHTLSCDDYSVTWTDPRVGDIGHTTSERLHAGPLAVADAGWKHGERFGREGQILGQGTGDLLPDNRPFAASILKSRSAQLALMAGNSRASRYSIPHLQRRDPVPQLHYLSAKLVAQQLDGGALLYSPPDIV